MPQSDTLIVIPPGGGRAIRSTGHSSLGLATGDETAGRYAAQGATVAARNRNRAHYHTREAECFLIGSGKMQVLYDGAWTDAPAGSAIHLPAGVPHAIRNHGVTPARIASLFVPAGLEGLFAELQAGATDMAAVAATFGVTMLDDDATPPDAPGAPEGQSLVVRAPDAAAVARFDGGERRALVTRAETGGTYAVDHLTLDPGAALDLTASGDLGAWILDGTATLTVGGDATPGSTACPPGTFLHAPPSTAAALTNTGDGPLTAFVWGAR